MDAEAISKRLIQLRGEKTQEEVSKAVGVSKSALSKMVVEYREMK